jgi:hypothetical protein
MSEPIYLNPPRGGWGPGEGPPTLADVARQQRRVVEPQQPNRTAGTRFAGLNACAVRTRGVRNKTEAAWERELESAREAGEIVGEIKFEEVKVRVTDAVKGERSVWYTPDFAYTLADGTFVLDDVKGGAVNEASIVRIKAAASRHPRWRFRIVTKLPKGEWDVREV